MEYSMYLRCEPKDCHATALKDLRQLFIRITQQPFY